MPNGPFHQSQRAGNPDRIYRRSGSPPCDGCRAALKIILDALPVRAAAPVSRRGGGGPVRPAGADRARAGCHSSRCAGKSLPVLRLSPKATDRRRPRHRLAGGFAGRLLPAASDRCRLRHEEVPLIVAPPRAFGGDFDRCWLLAVQLYGVRSARNWGIGDFTDLEGLIELAGRAGRRRRRPQSAARAVRRPPGRLQPLFAEQPAVSQCALYRRRKASGISARRSRRSSDALARLRASEIVDYAAVAELKWRALRAAFETFRAEPTAARRQDFEKFRAERGPLLSRFACFEVLRHKFNKPWWEWPEQWRQPDDGQMRRAASRARMPPRSNSSNSCNGSPTGSLRACRDLASTLGMKVGLYLDVAVGVQSDGFDAWNEQVGDLPPSRGRRAAGSAEHRRPELGPRRLQRRRPRNQVVRAVPRDAAGLDAPCRRDPARSCARPEAALSGAARLCRRQRRLCADAVRGAAGGDRAGERGASLRGDRRGSRHRAGRLSRADGRLGHLVVSGDDVRARRSRPVPRRRPLSRRTRSSPSTPTICRPMRAGARSAISS